MALTFALHEFTIFQSDIHDTQCLKMNFYESDLKYIVNILIFAPKIINKIS